MLCASANRRNGPAAGTARGSAITAIAAAVSLYLTAPVLAQQSPGAQRGMTYVRVHCAQCHSIDMLSESPLTIAPPLRTLHTKFPIDTLRRRLAEGISASHPTMPQFRLDADQINDVLEYLKSLER